MEMKAPYIALGSRLRGIPEVITLGVKPNFPEYTSEQQNLIANAPVVLYPTLNYAQFFTTIGKKIFPRKTLICFTSFPPQNGINVARRTQQLLGGCGGQLKKRL